MVQSYRKKDSLGLWHRFRVLPDRYLMQSILMRSGGFRYVDRPEVAREEFMLNRAEIEDRYVLFLGMKFTVGSAFQAEAAGLDFSVVSERYLVHPLTTEVPGRSFGTASVPAIKFSPIGIAFDEESGDIKFEVGEGLWFGYEVSYPATYSDPAMGLEETSTERLPEHSMYVRMLKHARSEGRRLHTTIDDESRRFDCYYSLSLEEEIKKALATLGPRVTFVRRAKKRGPRRWRS
jgi:hypothetical protein